MHTNEKLIKYDNLCVIGTWTSSLTPGTPSTVDDIQNAFDRALLIEPGSLQMNIIMALVSKEFKSTNPEWYEDSITDLEFYST